MDHPTVVPHRDAVTAHRTVSNAAQSGRPFCWNGVDRPHGLHDRRHIALPGRRRRRVDDAPRKRAAPAFALAVLAQIVFFLMPLPLQAQPVDPEAGGIPIELQPYRVRISLGFDVAPEFTAAYRNAAINELHNRLDRTFGAMWEMAVIEEGLVQPARQEVLERLTAASFEKSEQAARLDKWFVLTVETSGSAFRLAAREWDGSSRELSLPQMRTTWDRRALAQQACLLVRELFQPIVAIDKVEEDRVEVRIRAGEFPALDPAAAQLSPGDVLAPYFRYFDAEKTLRRVQSIPWTYLVVESVDRSRAVCRVKTGLRASLGGAARLVEKAARRIRPLHQATRLTLQVRGRGAKPLAGYEVSLRPDRDEANRADVEPAVEPQTLLSDRWGVVTVPRNPENPLVWMSVRSGNALLARVPFAPGVAPEATLELPDDGIRLDVEGQLAVVTADLVDTVARRAVVMAQILSNADANKWDRVDSLMAELSSIPGYQQYEARVRNIRVTATERAQQAGDRLAEARVGNLCRDALNVVAKYLDEDRLRDFRNEVDEVRRSAQTQQRSRDRPSGRR